MYKYIIIFLDYRINIYKSKEGRTMNFLGQTTIIKSIGVLSKNLYKKKVETIGFILLE